MAFGLNAQTCTIQFKIKNAGFTVDGTMAAGKIDFNFNPDDLASSSIMAEADPSSVKTGIDLRDKHLKKRDYFDVANHPVITMQSVSFEKQDKNTFAGYFDLTLKQTTQRIKMIITVVYDDNDKPTYRGSFKINRLDYQLGEKSLILDEDVNVLLTLKH